MLGSISSSHLGCAIAALSVSVALVVGCSSSGATNDDGTSTQSSASDPYAEPLPGPDAAARTVDAGTAPSGERDAEAGDAAKAYDGGPNACAPLTFPSGVRIQTFEDKATTATYAGHLGAGEKAPTCFLDVKNLVNADDGTVLPITVMLSAHFALDELVGTEVAQGYGHFVLMQPAAVAALEKFRDALNVPVSVNSGFRSPKHQEAVCSSLCGNPLGCSGTCANNSRHMFGDAFDLPLEFYTTGDEKLACSSGFKFAYKESGTHLHIDQNPAYATCVIQ